MLYVRGTRGSAEQEKRNCIPVPAVPVQEFWQEKSRKIFNSLNWFKGVTFTFWIKMHRKNIFPKINSKNYKFLGFFPARYPVPALPEPEYKLLFPVPLTPYCSIKSAFCNFKIESHKTNFQCLVDCHTQLISFHDLPFAKK